MCAEGTCGVMASASLVGASSVGRSGTSQASQPTLSQPSRLEAGFTWRAASGLGAGFGCERNAPLPRLIPRADAGRLMISRLRTLVGSAPAPEHAVLSATMAATCGYGCKSGASLLA